MEGPKLEARISEGYDSVPKYQSEFLGDPPEEQEIQNFYKQVDLSNFEKDVWDKAYEAKNIVLN